MRVIVFLILTILNLSLFAETIITYRGPETDSDKRMEYPLALLTEALVVTKNEYGDFKLQPSIRMNSKRAERVETADLYPNYIVEASVTSENEENLLSIKIPTTKGLYGYRLFLILDENKQQFNNIENIEDLKKIPLGQGSTWLDTLVLENAGFNIIKGRTYGQIINMLIAGRVLAFPRGINEAYKEFDLLKSEYYNLMVEDTICIYYPLPKFLYTSKKNTLLHERVTKGLLLMIENGSFDEIWEHFNSDYIKSTKLNDRKIFRIENIYIPSIVPLDNDKFWYVPETKTE